MPSSCCEPSCFCKPFRTCPMKRVHLEAFRLPGTDCKLTSTSCRLQHLLTPSLDPHVAINVVLLLRTVLLLQAVPHLPIELFYIEGYRLAGAGLQVDVKQVADCYIRASQASASAPLLTASSCCEPFCFSESSCACNLKLVHLEVCRLTRTDLQVDPQPVADYNVYGSQALPRTSSSTPPFFCEPSCACAVLTFQMQAHRLAHPDGRCTNQQVADCYIYRCQASASPPPAAQTSCCELPCACAGMYSILNTI